jgi:hypothetical protein
MLLYLGCLDKIWHWCNNYIALPAHTGSVRILANCLSINAQLWSIFNLQKRKHMFYYSMCTSVKCVGFYYVNWNMLSLCLPSWSHGHDYPSALLPCCIKTVPCERNNPPPSPQMCWGIPQEAFSATFIAASETHPLAPNTYTITRF